DAFSASAREFAARWSRATESDEIVCTADGADREWHWNLSWRLPRPCGRRGDGLPAVAWTSHFLEQGGYTEEAIATVEALDDAGIYVAASPVMVTGTALPRDAKQAARVADLMARDLPEDFVHVAHIGANRFKRHPAAMRSVGRPMFETDGLPANWRDRCNLMDEVWVPSEHNLHTFTRAGVKASKLHKVPETFDTEAFHPGVPPLPVDDVE